MARRECARIDHTHVDHGPILTLGVGDPFREVGKSEDQGPRATVRVQFGGPHSSLHFRCPKQRCQPKQRLNAESMGPRRCSDLQFYGW